MTELLDRWQFGVTIVYHFLFVPLTIGLGLLVAWMQTLAYRRRDADWDRLARFFGRLFLINFALGVVTGIVQEFQFGMNWSNYSIFAGCRESLHVLYELASARIAMRSAG